jgi:hypothetical protein
MDHQAEATRLAGELAGRDEVAAQAAAAVVHALLHLASEVRHGLRDLVYEMRA